MSPIVISELLSGSKGGRREEDNARQLRQFLAQERVCVVNVSEETSEFYAFILEALRKSGRPIPTNDSGIAASVLEHGARLATRDKHFAQIDGIMLVGL
ncbi:PIN domain-containing protein [Candidatus Sumerlaeota bacterium]